jgi:cbb3-type cytochrome oxidase subunit 1
MHRRNRWFLTLALGYALLGGLLGIAWLIMPGALPGLPVWVHGHLMLLGFVAMMIYGVAFHVLPRFAGRTMYSERIATWQFFVANAGLLTMAAGGFAASTAVMAAGGALSVLAIAMFAANVVMTIRMRAPGG